MPECPISLIGEISTNPPKETWYIEPRPFNPNGKCTVKITASSPKVGAKRVPITGTGDVSGDFGSFHVSGTHIQNGMIVLEPPPKKDVRIEWDITCPECTKQLRHDFGALPKPPFESNDAWTILVFTIIFAGEGALIGGLFGGPVGLLIGAAVGIVIGLGGTSLLIWLLRKLGIL
jgi:hypothetical protein